MAAVRKLFQKSVGVAARGNARFLQSSVGASRSGVNENPESNFGRSLTEFSQDDQILRETGWFYAFRFMKWWSQGAFW